MDTKKIKTALISVFHKDGLETIAGLLKQNGIKIFSTGGTMKYLQALGLEVVPVEDFTSYPSILGGRVKTLHPKIFGGILARREQQDDIQEVEKYEIPLIDLVVVDLYPFEETVKNAASEQEIIEMIDIGGISLIRAAAKNFNDVVVIPSKDFYPQLEKILQNKGQTTLSQRKELAKQAFKISYNYDRLIHNFFAGVQNPSDSQLIAFKELRYGENPHQKAVFYGKLDDILEQLNGKEISYNNLLDIDAAVNLISEFDETTVAIIKHTNACGVASRDTVFESFTEALSGDPLSAFGGIIISNRKIDLQTAEKINSMFYEVLIAPGFDDQALELLRQKKKRIILKLKHTKLPANTLRSALNGILEQERDLKTETAEDFKFVTNRKPTDRETEDLIFANKIVKHTKSNAIVLVKNKKLIGSGMGQTSRVDALKHAIEKAREFNHDLQDAVMASDAFFPFADSVELAHNHGITAVIQPGGSIRDQDSIDFCNAKNMAMVFTGIRHFKH